MIKIGSFTGRAIQTFDYFFVELSSELNMSQCREVLYSE